MIIHSYLKGLTLGTSVTVLSYIADRTICHSRGYGSLQGLGSLHGRREPGHGKAADRRFAAVGAVHRAGGGQTLARRPRFITCAGDDGRRAIQSNVRRRFTRWACGVPARSPQACGRFAPGPPRLLPPAHFATGPLHSSRRTE